MKLLQIGNAHPRNTEFIQRMCNKRGIEYIYSNQPIPDANFDIVWAPSNWVNPTLYPNSKILYGPQFWIFPSSDHAFFKESIPEDSKRCVYTCLSPWIYDAWETFIEIDKSNIPILPLPFGLDLQPIQPTKKELQTDCIVYFKARHPSLLTSVIQGLEQLGITYKVYKYGTYQRDQYIQELNKTKFVIWIGSHESQGFALQECLSTNTPILVLDVKSMKDEYNNGYPYHGYVQPLLATSAPYWDSCCGKKVSSLEELFKALPEFLESYSSFQPSEFVKDTLSDDICIERIFNTLNLKLT